MRLKDRLAFKAGSDELNDRIKPVLDRVHALLASFPSGLSIEGHTDDRPIHSSRFPSNWDLSAARASATLRYLEHDGPLAVEALRVTAHGAQKPLYPNDTEEHRASNRRVEFVFERAPTKRTTLADLRPASEEVVPLVRLEPVAPGEEGASPSAYKVLPTTATLAELDQERRAQARAAELAKIPAQSDALARRATDSQDAQAPPDQQPPVTPSGIAQPTTEAPEARKSLNDVLKERLKELSEERARKPRK